MSKEMTLPTGAPKSFEDLRTIAELYGVSIPLEAPFTPNDFNKALPLLRLPLDENAIQESKGSETRKGYDTTGYAYQAHVDRMNWVLGPTNWTWRIINEEYDGSQTTRSGHTKHSYYSEIELLIGYRDFNEESKSWEWITVHSVPPIPTDHDSFTEKGAARKGMMTKGIKRATSFLGVGADAYLGTLDDDLITGAVPGDEVRTAPRKFEDRVVDSKDYGQLIDLAKVKGFKSEEKLRDFYRTKSEGRITNDPANMTKAEAKEVKFFLLDLPDYQEAIPEKQSPSEEAVEESEEITDWRPKTLAELMAADESTFRKIAAEYSFRVPDQLTDKNRGPLCKTLGKLMKLE